MLRLVLLLSAVTSVGLGAAIYRDALLGDIQAIRSYVVNLPGLKASPPAASPPASAPVRVKAAPVRLEPVPIYLPSIGTIQAYNTVAVKTRVDGEIVKILFEEGRDVKANDVLAVIDPRPFEAQLRQQQAMLRKDKATLEGALLDLQRYETLVVKNFASQQQVDQQRATVDETRAQIENDEASIEYAKTQLMYTTIRAPIDGRVGVRLVDQGNIVRAADNAPIVVITQLQPISVIFTVSANLAARSRLTPGRVNLPVIALAADNKTQLDRGTIDVVDNQVDQTTGTIKLKASFPNEALRLWPGNFVNGRVVVDTRRGLTVSSNAVRHGPRGDFVWVVQNGNTVKTRDVTVVQTSDGRALLERGVNRGEQVVTEGYYRLENGSRVEVAHDDKEEAPRARAQAAPEPVD